MILPGDNDERHGTVTGYQNQHCRCRDCKEAKAVYMHDRYVKARTKEGKWPPPPPAGRTHGLISCYQAGCRCDDCKRAARDAQRRYRQRKARR